MQRHSRKLPLLFLVSSYLHQWPAAQEFDIASRLLNVLEIKHSTRFPCQYSVSRAGIEPGTLAVPKAPVDACRAAGEMP